MEKEEMNEKNPEKIDNSKDINEANEEEEKDKEDNKKDKEEEEIESEEKKEEENKEDKGKEDKEKEVEDKEKDKEDKKEDKRKEEEKYKEDKEIKKDSEKICETFEVSDKDGPHEVVTCNTVPKKHANKKEVASYNKILRNILIVLGIIIIAFIAWMIFLNTIKSVKYNDLSFEVVSQGDLIFYKHVVPLYNGDTHYANYNFFLRTNPYKTGAIPFDGELNLRKVVAINSTEFLCEGKGVIAMANLLKPFEVAGLTVVADQNASCDNESKYVLLNIYPGDENKIIQTGETCYDMVVKDCDILDVTERMMIEMFVMLDDANSDIENKENSDKNTEKIL